MGIVKAWMMEMEERGYRTHEFGDSVLIEKSPVST